MTRLLYIVTHPMTARNLLCGQLAFMRSKEMETLLITSPDPCLAQLETQEGIQIYPVSIQREIQLFQDLRSFLKIYSLIRKLKPDIVNASTPKAGFLGMMAAAAARVPFRIYTLRGLRLETKKGFTRFILSTTERIASACSHSIICVSDSLKKLYLDLKITKPEKLVVIGSGSSNGVNLKRFHPLEDPERKIKLKEQLGIPSDALVIGFVGRLTTDKGIIDLMSSFELLLSSFPKLHLLIIGDFEEGDPVPVELIKKVQHHSQIVRTGFVNETSQFYPAMDLLVFPSYREGFPNTPLEAAACKIPTVGYDVTGTRDAIVDQETGRLIAFRDVEKFTSAISEYLSNSSMRAVHGNAAYERVIQHFQNEIVWNGIYQFLAQRKPVR